MRRRTPTLLCTAAAAVALFGTAACGGSDVKSSSSAGTGGTLTIQGDAGNPTLVENFNPFASTALHGQFLMYEPLEIPSPIDGTYTPFLATGYKFTNPTTLVYTLRPNVKWSDGQAFSVTDVTFTFNLLKKFPALDTRGIWAQVASVSGAGNTFTVTFKQPNVPFAAQVAQVPIVPAHVWSSVADPVKYTDTKPVVTGPFTLDTFAPTQYKLKKNPNYWQANKVSPSEVAFPAQASNQTTNQLDVTSGKFDWAYTFIPDVKNTYVNRDSAHNTYWFPPGGTIGLFLNLTKAPYDNASFRKGVSESLNRTTIAQKAVNGYLDQASMSGLILPNLQKWLDPSIPNSGLITQSSSQAQQDFAAAGYHLTGGKLVGSNGKQATMTIVLPGNFSDWVAAAKEVATELGQAGIKVSLDLPQYAQYATATQGGTFDAAMGGFGGSGDPYTDFNNGLNSSFATPVKTPTVNNFERFKDPAVDQALGTLAGATDPSSAQKATFALEQVMYNQVPVVLLYYGGSWGLFRDNHFTGWPSAQDPYTLPTNYTNAMLVVATHLKSVS
ncbi:MAG TPA: ABC transporter substrate-binding protein [Micromonosporaceae bacterium]|jgi:peptide/nickel transport system substrate-binding protein